MTTDPDEQDQMSPKAGSDVQYEAEDDTEEDEEIPSGVMIILLVLAVGIAVIYLTIGGGHNHFH